MENNKSLCATKKINNLWSSKLEIDIVSKGDNFIVQSSEKYSRFGNSADHLEDKVLIDIMKMSRSEQEWFLEDLSFATECHGIASRFVTFETTKENMKILGLEELFFNEKGIQMNIKNFFLKDKCELYFTTNKTSISCDSERKAFDIISGILFKYYQ